MNSINQDGENLGNQKPNVLLILADDVGTGDVPGYWNTELVTMPNIENLIMKGTTFSDAHSSPLCSPSRYVLLLGNYQHRGVAFQGTWTLNNHRGQFLPGQKSLANVLRDGSNYYTAMMGKWHIGGKSTFAIFIKSCKSSKKYKPSFNLDFVMLSNFFN